MNKIGGIKAKILHKPKIKLVKNHPNHSPSNDRLRVVKPNKPKKLNIKIDSSQPAQLRKDYINDYYALIAPKRHARPKDTVEHFCPFFETADSPRLDQQKEIYSTQNAGGHWLTKVVDNKFPSLTLDNPQAYGKQEIVIDTPLSNRSLGELSKKQLIELFLTYKQRCWQLQKINNIKYVLVFKNHGIEAGASLAHSHTQIFALPLVPPEIMTEANKIEATYKTKQVDSYEEIIKFEKKEKLRLVSENKNFVAICPYASRWPLESWVISKKNISNFADFNENQIYDLVELFQPIVAKLTYHDISYNFFLQNGVSKSQRFVLKFQARNISTWGGFEVATGIIINTVPPESATRWYKE